MLERLSVEASFEEDRDAHKQFDFADKEAVDVMVPQRGAVVAADMPPEEWLRKGSAPWHGSRSPETPEHRRGAPPARPC